MMMKRIIPAIILLTSMSHVAMAQNPDGEDAVKALKDEISLVKDNIKTLEKKSKNLQGEIKKLNNESDKLAKKDVRKKVIELQARQADLTGRINRANAKIAETDAEIRQLQRQIADKRAIIDGIQPEVAKYMEAQLPSLDKYISQPFSKIDLKELELRHGYYSSVLSQNKELFGDAVGRINHCEGLKKRFDTVNGVLDKAYVANDVASALSSLDKLTQEKGISREQSAELEKTRQALASYSDGVKWLQSFIKDFNDYAQGYRIDKELGPKTVQSEFKASIADKKKDIDRCVAPIPYLAKKLEEYKNQIKERPLESDTELEKEILNIIL